MKNTGIIRKIDELGRIVIPKEIRKVLKISSNDDLEIYVENEFVVLKKYSEMYHEKSYNDQLISAVKELTQSSIFISDKEKIITKGILEGKNIDDKLKELLIERRNYLSECAETIYFADYPQEGYYMIKPLIRNSDAIGLIIIMCPKKVTQEDMLLLDVIKNLIEKQ